MPEQDRAKRMVDVGLEEFLITFSLDEEEEEEEEEGIVE